MCFESVRSGFSELSAAQPQHTQHQPQDGQPGIDWYQSNDFHTEGDGLTIRIISIQFPALFFRSDRDVTF